jgi:methionyl-tRNA formyltransferase
VLNILYAGSPEPSALVLDILLNDRGFTENCRITGVLTNPPSSHGRHKVLVPTPVEIRARSSNIVVFHPDHLNKESRDMVSSVAPDILVCFAYGHIFGPKFLGLFTYGGINLHPSLLPKYRGPTPVQQAILNMDTETGITVQKMAQETDAGDVLLQQKIKLDGTETTASLLEKSARLGAASLSEILIKTARTSELPPAVPQQGIPSYTQIVKKEDGCIDWSEPAEKIQAKIRAYTPEPGCYTVCRGMKLRILEAELVPGACDGTAESGIVVSCSKNDGILVKTGDGLLSLKTLQWQSKKPLCCKDFMNGARGFGGTRLGY